MARPIFCRSAAQETSRGRGFNLVEMLVVTAIVAILIAILLTVLGRAVAVVRGFRQSRTAPYTSQPAAVLMTRRPSGSGWIN